MKLQVHLSSFLATLFSLAWVDCANVSCASMRSWFPGTLPSNFADKSPFELSISGHSAEGYFPGSSHTVYLNGSMTGDNKIRSFIGFIVYAENSVKHYINGRFVKEDLPAGVEEASCGDLYIIQNSTSSGSWTSVNMLWKSPKDGYLAGNITFRASVLEKTNPLTYYEGFTACLKYQCPLRKCVPCPGSVYNYDSYGCRTCQCGGCDFACPEIYDPVCGTDGKTYNNTCRMELEACTEKKIASVDHKGECSVVGGCKSCTTEIAPVCGTDGEPYINKCAMEAKACKDKKNITVSYKGDCKNGAEKLRVSVLSLMFAFLALLWFSV